MSKRRRGLITAAAATLFALPSYAASAGWTDHLPEGWLAVVAVGRPLELREQASEFLPADTLPDWVAGVEEQLRVLLGIENRQLAIGAAKADDGSFEPFALLPSDDYQNLLDRLDADQGNDEAFASLLGYELRLQPAGDHAWVALADSTLRPGTASQVCTDDSDADLSVHLSDAGLEATHGLAAEQRAKRLATGKTPRYSLRTRQDAVRSVCELTPLLAVLAESWNQASISVERIDEGTLSVVLTGSASDGPSSLPPQASGLANALARDEIAFLAVGGPAPGLVAELLAAVVACRADTVGAREYNAGGLRQLSASLGNFTDQVEAFRAEWSTPRSGEPLVANRQLLFRSTSDLRSAMTQLVASWNALVKATLCETPLEVTLEPPSETDSMRLATDVSAALGEELADPIMPMLERVFGPGGVSVEEFARIDADHWRLSAPVVKEDNTPLPIAANDESRLHGEVRIDRWLRWQRRIEEVFAGDVLGKKPAPAIPECPPVRIDAVISADDAIMVRLSAPTQTIRTAIELLIPARP